MTRFNYQGRRRFRRSPIIGPQLTAIGLALLALLWLIQNGTP